MITTLPAGTPTVAQLLAAGRTALQEGGSPTPRLDAELLLGHAIGRDRAWLLAHPEAPVDEEAAWADALRRRVAGEPIAYIRGFKEWRSLRIRTDARALIPRPETELLTEAAIEQIAARLVRDDRSVTAWEIGTGSGAVAMALALRFRSAITLGRMRLIASDVSPDALELATENLEAHRVATLVDLALADLLEPAGASLPLPDVVVANLPYVATAEVEARHGSLGFEPRIAVDGGADGLSLLAPLLASLPERVAAGGTVLLEVGVGQAAAVAELAPRGATVEVVPDLAGVERIVRVDLEPGA